MLIAWKGLWEDTIVLSVIKSKGAQHGGGGGGLRQEGQPGLQFLLITSTPSQEKKENIKSAPPISLISINKLPSCTRNQTQGLKHTECSATWAASLSVFIPLDEFIKEQWMLFKFLYLILITNHFKLVFSEVF